ncbi:MAG: RHS repeat protein [Lachnospiraceae bacterium]|nr:RHS repeat protein [Lachnospiraceae bacterium]
MKRMVLVIAAIVFTALLGACTPGSSNDNNTERAGTTETTYEKRKKELRDAEPNNGDSQSVPYDIPEILEGYALVFRVKREELQHNYLGMDPVVVSTLVSEYEYDANGNRIKTTEEDGSITESFYDEQNRLIKKVRHTFFQGVPEDEIAEYQYDSLGREVVRKEIGTDFEGTVFEVIYETVYAEDGSYREIYQTCPDEDRHIYDYSAYDQKGREICWQQYDTPYYSRQAAAMEYDEHDNLIRVISKIRDFDQPWKEYVSKECEYELDRFGVFRCMKEVRRSSYNPETPDYYYYLYQYDSDGRVSIIESYGSEEADLTNTTVIYGYDDYGNLISERTYDGDLDNNARLVDQMLYEYEPLVIPIECLTDEDRERGWNPENP